MKPQIAEDGSLLSRRHKDYIEMMTGTVSETSISRVTTENSCAASATARDEVPFARSTNANQGSPHGLERSAVEVEADLLEVTGVPILTDEEAHSSTDVQVFPVQERGPPGPDQDADNGAFQPSRPLMRMMGNSRRTGKQGWLAIGLAAILVVAVATVPISIVMGRKNKDDIIMTSSPTEEPSINYPITASPGTPAVETTSPLTAHSSFWRQLGPTLEGQAPRDDFGYSIALSADGRTLAAGARYHDIRGAENAGQVRVFQYHSLEDVWKPKGQDLYGQGVDERFGRSVALSGNALAVGVPRRNNKGAVRVFQYDKKSDYWDRLGNDLDGESDGDWFGHSVALSSSEGSNSSAVVAVGAPRNDGEGKDASGRMRVYEFSGDQWMQMGQDLDGEVEIDQFGWSVAISGDGKVVASSDRMGRAARVYEYNTSTSSWKQMGADLEGQGAVNATIISSVALSADGLTVAVGVAVSKWERDADGRPIRTSNAGYVQVSEFDRGSLKWRKKGEPLSGDAEDDSFGFSVSLSHNGDNIVASSFQKGYVRLYEFHRSSREWVQLGPDLIDEEPNDWFGFSVALSNQGTTIAASAPKHDKNGQDTGNVFVFQPEI